MENDTKLLSTNPLLPLWVLSLHLDTTVTNHLFWVLLPLVALPDLQYSGKQVDGETRGKLSMAEEI